MCYNKVISHSTCLAFVFFFFFKQEASLIFISDIWSCLSQKSLICLYIGPNLLRSLLPVFVIKTCLRNQRFQWFISSFVLLSLA